MRILAGRHEAERGREVFAAPLNVRLGLVASPRFATLRYAFEVAEHAPACAAPVQNAAGGIDVNAVFRHHSADALRRGCAVLDESFIRFQGVVKPHLRWRNRQSIVCAARSVSRFVEVIDTLGGCLIGRAEQGALDHLPEK